MVHVPYDLPHSWTWVALGSVFLYDAGTKREPNTLDQSFWLLELEDLEKDTGRLIARVRVFERASQSTKSEFKAGDILYGKLRPYLNKAIIADEPGYSSTEIVAIRSYVPLCCDYCALALRRPDFVEYVTRLGQGTKMPRLRTEDANIAPFPLPPLAEQYRIVAKVDELMVLCDALEATKAKRERRRDKLVAASLQRLNQPADDNEAFRVNANFIFQHLQRLTIRPEHIKQLRQSILSLAVRGRLVPQDSSDEPAALLLERIKIEQHSLNVGGRRKKNIDTSGPEKYVYPIPNKWCWTTLGDLIIFGPQNGISPIKVKDSTAPKALTLSATTSGFLNTGYFKNVALSEGECQDYWLFHGDVLFQRGNTREYVGMAAIYEGADESFVFPGLMIRVRFSGLLALRFIHLTMVSPPLRQYFSEQASGASSTMPKINQPTLTNAPVPLPPLAEQHRIVAKVDELMAVCDQLETQLTTTESDSRRFLEAVLQEALSPSLGKVA